MTSKKKILVFCDWYRPAFRAGGPVQSIVHLVERYSNEYDFFVFTSSIDLGGVRVVESSECGIWLERYGCRIQYNASGRLSMGVVRSIIQEVNPDWIYLNSMFSNMFFPLMAAYKSGKVILAPRGMLRPSAMAYKFMRKRAYLFLLRMLGIDQCIRFHATSEEEVNWIHSVFPQAQSIHIAPNISFPLPLELPKVEKEMGHLRIAIVGRMQSIKNIHKALEYIQQVEGRIAIDIFATPDDPHYRRQVFAWVSSLAARSIQVKVHEECRPEQVYEHLMRSHLFVLPTKGESFCHAIMESLSCGCPVLISDQTPWRNLSQDHAGLDLPLNNDVAWVNALRAFVCMDNDQWQQYRQGARKRAERYVKTSDLDVKYQSLFENMG